MKLSNYQIYDWIQVINKAIKKLMKHDSHLIRVGCSERSLCHRLAIYIEQELSGKGIHVDCEYNRQSFDPKRATSEGDDKPGSCVTPDIIVHKRGSKKNYLAIEAKPNLEVSAEDREKVKAYILDHGYQFGLMLSFRRQVDGSDILEWWVRDQNGAPVQHLSRKDIQRDVGVTMNMNKVLADLKITTTQLRPSQVAQYSKRVRSKRTG